MELALLEITFFSGTIFAFVLPVRNLPLQCALLMFLIAILKGVGSNFSLGGRGPKELDCDTNISQDRPSLMPQAFTGYSCTPVLCDSQLL